MIAEPTASRETPSVRFETTSGERCTCREKPGRASKDKDQSVKVGKGHTLDQLAAMGAAIADVRDFLAVDLRFRWATGAECLIPHTRDRYIVHLKEVLLTFDHWPADIRPGSGAIFGLKSPRPQQARPFTGGGAVFRPGGYLDRQARRAFSVQTL